MSNPRRSRFSNQEDPIGYSVRVPERRSQRGQTVYGRYSIGYHVNSAGKHRRSKCFSSIARELCSCFQITTAITNLLNVASQRGNIGGSANHLSNVGSFLGRYSITTDTQHETLVS